MSGNYGGHQSRELGGKVTILLTSSSTNNLIIFSPCLAKVTFLLISSTAESGPDHLKLIPNLQKNVRPSVIFTRHSLLVNTFTLHTSNPHLTFGCLKVIKKNSDFQMHLKVSSCIYSMFLQHHVWELPFLLPSRYFYSKGLKW